MSKKDFITNEESYSAYEARRSSFFMEIGIAENKDNIRKYNRLKAIGYTSKKMEEMF